MKDLFIVLPDSNTEAAVKALLESRTKSLAIRTVGYDVARHPQRDPGVRVNGHELARTVLGRYARCLTIIDHEGSGAEEDAASLRARLVANLLSVGWVDDAVEVVVIEPELEAWVWGRRRQLAALAGWTVQDLESWLVEHGSLSRGSAKPAHPKEALEAFLLHARVQRTSALYSRLAREVSLQLCQDPAFQRLVDALRRWFPANPSAAAGPP